MKKSNLLFVLSAFVLIGGIAGCSTNEPSKSTSTSTSTVATKHAVVIPTSVAGAYVTASRSEAIAGDSVELTVALTDPTNYELKSVKVGEQVLEGTADANNANVFHYSFVMGDADANVSVVTEQIAAPTKDHTISFEGKDLAFALEMPQDANVGEHVSFKVAARSGYEITSVKVVKVNAASAADDGEEPAEEEVALTGNVVVGYSFDMPDADVVIKAEALGAYFKVNADDEKTIFQAKGSTSSDSKLKVSSFVYSFIDSEKVEQKTKSSYFRAGSEVIVVAKHNPFAIANKFFANGVELVKVDSDTAVMYKFTMPATSVELSVDPVDAKVEVNVDAGDHTTTSLYRIKADKSHEETTFGYPGETLYLDLEINETDAEDYNLPSSVSSSMQYYNDDKALTTSSCNISTTQQSGATNLKATYSILVTSYYTSAGAIEVNAHERYLKQYLGKDFVGQYYGYEIYNSSFYGSAAQLTMGADGSLTIPGSYSTKTDIVVSCDDDNKTVTLKERGISKYSSNGSIWFFYDKSQSMNDSYFFSKNFTSASAIQKRTYSKNNLFVGEFYEVVDGSEIVRASIFMNKNDKTVVLEPTITLISGSNIADSDAKFLVKDGETLLAAVGVGDEYGTYKNGDSTLVLDGAGKATLDGVEGTYVVDSANKNKVTVTIAEVEHVYTIDKSAKTFTDYVEALKSLYSSFVSTKYNNTLVLNEDGSGKYSGEDIRNFEYDETTKNVSFEASAGTFDLTWDPVNGTLIGTYDDGDGEYNISFTIVVEEGPFYLGKFSFSLMNSSGYTTDAVLTITENSIDVTFTSFSGDGTKTSYSVTEDVTFQEKRIFGEGTKYIEVTINPTTKTVTKVEIFANGEADSAQYESDGSLTKQA